MNDKPIMAKTLFDAYPHNTMLALDSPPREGESVSDYVFRLGIECQGSAKILGGDSIFQYVLLAAKDARGDLGQLLADLLGGVEDLTKVARAVARLHINEIAEDMQNPPGQSRDQK